MARNKSEKDPLRDALMAYARASEAYLAAKGAPFSEREDLNEACRATYLAIPSGHRADLGWGRTQNLETIRSRYGQIDGA